MGVDLQKAGLWKRMAAWLLDAIMIAVVAVGVGALLSGALNYDHYSNQVHEGYARYEQEYGVSFSVTEQQIAEMTPEQKEKYDAAIEALMADDQLNDALTMSISLITVNVSLSFLAAILLTEFLVPLLMGNGQTLGKKAFSLGVIRVDSVKMSTFQLFVRSVLGKYTMEIMFPVYIMLMVIFGSLNGSLGLVLLAAMIVIQIVVMGVTQNNSAIHDLLAGTVAVDISSQQIFKSTDELIAHTKRIHAEQAAREEY